ncbi:Invasion associated family protein [hydrothermal vent metagenome]|uniref:Invasion associated family protein n=1 Tax=hydrothermal vent metagenome TaxID=652676 RepID=A0A3B0RD99_9ZZZZ
MPRLFTTLPLIAALALGTAVFAQTDTTTDTADQAAETDAAHDEGASSDATTDETTTTEATTTESKLDMGDNVAADAPYIKETYGDWQLKCFKNGTEDGPCQMYQLLRESAGNPVAEISIFRLPEGGQAIAGATVVVPLGTLLTKELKISVDGGRAKSFSYAFCNPTGCFSRIGLTADDVAAFKQGAAANLVIVPAQAPDQTITINASLDGFTAAFKNVTTLNQ